MTNASQERASQKRAAQKQGSKAMKVAIVCLWLCLCLVLALPQFAFGESLSPEEVEVSTPLYDPNFAGFEPALGEYEYRVSWKGLGAARMKVKVEREGYMYRITTTAKTNSFVDVFYRLRYRATGIISAVDLLPVKTVINQTENSRVKRTEIAFLPSGEIHSVRWRKGRGTKELRFDPRNFTLDPFSAAFLARSLDWEVGQTRDFDTFNGKSRYLIQLTASDLIKMKVNGEERDVFVISPQVRKLTDPHAKSKLNEAKIYVTADKKREILKIESEVFVGTVRTQLEVFRPSSKPVPGRQLAQLQEGQQFKFD